MLSLSSLYNTEKINNKIAADANNVKIEYKEFLKICSTFIRSHMPRRDSAVKNKVRTANNTEMIFLNMVYCLGLFKYSYNLIR